MKLKSLVFTCSINMSEILVIGAVAMQFVTSKLLHFSNYIGYFC
ncbi:hypothetical protein FCR2A7T_21150 [Flavobacterium cauense R2A-7]|nr:hypothetical protein FCR2A7T_21150 [Flavobacterium cauense R2A-7]